MKKEKSDQMVNVLYQKMAGKWFIFSLVNDEVFFGSLSPSDLEKNLTSEDQLRISIDDSDSMTHISHNKYGED